MNNKEKKDYLNLRIVYQSTPFMSEIIKKKDFIDKIPKSLFKYRKFDEHTVDMIENDYVYLAAAKILDDPFDCLTDVDLNAIYEKGTNNLKTEIIEYIIDIVNSYTGSKKIDKSKMMELIERSTKEGIVDREVILNELNSEENLTETQKDVFYAVFSNFQNTLDEMVKQDEMSKLVYSLYNSREKVGVCSFTTKRDNKPMWSLYANQYKGYCIEYEVPHIKNILFNLCPVIYSSNYDNNILKAILRFGIEAIIRNISSGQIGTNLGCFTELLCTKDKDWESQDEWRLIGDANSKIQPMLIKNIYLGFRVSRKYQKQILDLALKKHFGVYKMNKPSGSNKITYTKIN